MFTITSVTKTQNLWVAAPLPAARDDVLDVINKITVRQPEPSLRAKPSRNILPKHSCPGGVNPEVSNER